METHQIRILWGVGSWAGCVLASTANEAGSRTLEKSSRRDRDRDCAKFESSRRFRGSNMKPKKKSRHCRPRFSDLSFHAQPWFDGTRNLGNRSFYDHTQTFGDPPAAGASEVNNPWREKSVLTP